MHCPSERAKSAKPTESFRPVLVRCPPWQALLPPFAAALVGCASETSIDSLGCAATRLAQVRTWRKSKGRSVAVSGRITGTTREGRIAALADKGEVALVLLGI